LTSKMLSGGALFTKCVIVSSTIFDMLATGDQDHDYHTSRYESRKKRRRSATRIRNDVGVAVRMRASTSAVTSAVWVTWQCSYGGNTLNILRKHTEHTKHLSVGDLPMRS
jgi:hypothetical protein